MHLPRKVMSSLLTVVAATAVLWSAVPARASVPPADTGTPYVSPPEATVVPVGHDRFTNGITDTFLIRRLPNGDELRGVLVTHVLEETAADGSSRTSAWAQIFQEICGVEGTCEDAPTRVIEGEVPRSSFEGDWDGLRWASLAPVTVPSRSVAADGTVTPSEPVDVTMEWTRDPSSFPIDFREPWVPEVNGAPVPYVIPVPSGDEWCSTHVKEAAVRRVTSAIGTARLVLDGTVVEVPLRDALIADHLTHQATIRRDAIVYTPDGGKVVGGLAPTC